MHISIEELINLKLKGYAHKNVADLITHIREDDDIFTISTCEYNEESTWSGCNISDLGYIVINGTDEIPGPWTFWFNASNLGEHSKSPIDEHVKEFAWNHVSPCGKCIHECNATADTIILGKKFENTCQSNLIFVNPDAEAIEFMKKLVDIKKVDIVGNK